MKLVAGRKLMGCPAVIDVGRAIAGQRGRRDVLSSCQEHDENGSRCGLPDVRYYLVAVSTRLVVVLYSYLVG